MPRTHGPEDPRPFELGRRRSLTSLAGALLAALLVASPACPHALEPDRVRLEYRAVLALLSAGQHDEALTGLLALERRALAEKDPAAAVEQLWKAKLSVVRDLLGGQQFELLVPILVMHQEAYREYREERLHLLARHSADMAAELADFYAKRSGDPAAAMLASDLLTSLAGYLQEGWSLSTSARFFTRALELDPNNEVAHLGLAALYEKRADYDSASQHLRSALAERRHDADTQLRLALCLLRSERPDEAEAMLSELAAAGEPAWVGVLAVQELAMLYGRRSEFERAEQVLQAGRERFPDNQRLAIQMIWVREKLGRPSGSALAELDAVERAEETGTAPRYRYTLWPSDWLRELRQGLRSTADSRNVVLAAALAAAPTAEAAS